MSLITPMGHCDVTLALYDVNGERRVVVKVDGVHIVEEADGRWSIFGSRGGEGRAFSLLGQAVVAAEALARSRDV